MNLRLTQEITDEMRLILKILVEEKYLSTSQIRRKAFRSKSLRTLQRYLYRMKELKLVKSFVIQPSKGRASEYGWLLRQAGASVIGVSYNVHYSRLPTLDQLRHRENQLELERRVEEAGWRLIKPQIFCRANPVPEETRQYRLLVEAIECRERKAFESAPKGESLVSSVQSLNYEQGLHKWGLPRKANDYLAYLDYGQGDKLAVVLILCPQRATIKFWKRRVEEYAAVAQKLYVVGVFENQAEGLAHKTLLNQHRIALTTLAQLKTLLNSIKAKYDGIQRNKQ